MGKQFLLLLTTVFIFCYCFSNCQKVSSPSLLSTDSISNSGSVVAYQLAHQSTFIQRIVSNGILRTSSQSRLSFKIGGTLLQIFVQNGSIVNINQVLARLDDREQRMALRLAQDQVAETMVQLRGLIAEYGGHELDTTSLAPKARAFVLTKSGYFKARTSLAQAQQQLEYTELRAPFSGVVANLTAKPHNFITSYETFCTLLSQTGLLVEFSVLESELSTLRKGQTVQVQPIARTGRTYKGQVIEINPFVNAQGLVLVKARLNHPSSDLFEGMNAHVVVEQQIPNQLIIPKASIVERSGRKVVFTIENGLAKWHYVKIIFENESEVSISEGLRVGEKVITSGHLNLAHDAPVQQQQP